MAEDLPGTRAALMYTRIISFSFEAGLTPTSFAAFPRVQKDVLLKWYALHNSSAVHNEAHIKFDGLFTVSRVLFSYKEAFIHESYSTSIFLYDADIIWGIIPCCRD